MNVIHASSAFCYSCLLLSVPEGNYRRGAQLVFIHSVFRRPVSQRCWVGSWDELEENLSYKPCSAQNSSLLFGSVLQPTLCNSLYLRLTFQKASCVSIGSPHQASMQTWLPLVARVHSADFKTHPFIPTWMLHCHLKVTHPRMNSSSTTDPTHISSLPHKFSTLKKAK